MGFKLDVSRYTNPFPSPMSLKMQPIHDWILYRTTTPMLLPRIDISPTNSQQPSLLLSSQPGGAGYLLSRVSDSSLISNYPTLSLSQFIFYMTSPEEGNIMTMTHVCVREMCRLDFEFNFLDYIFTWSTSIFRRRMECEIVFPPDYTTHLVRKLKIAELDYSDSKRWRLRFFESTLNLVPAPQAVEQVVIASCFAPMKLLGKMD
ncbi:uncharacterized protein VTP21DRAFT_3246 [Calcarisporiella thermophila]|uniref:uncharacterized protein n=1 Tax=Calcarisporiella thermophila TaxID=911321 RepID=UPI003743FA2E